MSAERRTDSGISRRGFLQWAGVTGGAVYAGSLSGCNPGSLWERQPVVNVDQWTKGVCRFCGTGCGVMVGTNNGTVVDVKGDEYAHNRGRLCIKGILNRDILYASDRATHPLIRNGSGELVRASWDDAMELVGGTFRENIDRYGPTSVSFYGSGQLFTQESYTANKLFKAGIGSNHVDGNPRLCMASAVVGYLSTFGKDEPAGCYEDIDYADCFLITGSNTAECHPIIWERVQDRIRSAPGTFLVVVDPRRTRTARAADLHLAIRPGTDVALYNSMMYEFANNGWVDDEMVRDYLGFTRGGQPRTYDDFVRHLRAFAPDLVADAIGVNADDIRTAAFKFASSNATMSLWTMGINQQAQGAEANRGLNAMHLITGHIGRPGATPFSITGQPNAGGGVRDTGSLGHALPNGRVIANETHRNEMEDLWGVPRGTINPVPGQHAVGMFQAMESGEIKACLNMCTNPAQSLPNAGRYRAAMERAFFVVADAFHPTETSQYADVVLPTSMWAEKEGVFSQSERRYHLITKVVDPPGEARDDLSILVDLADRLGHGELIRARTPEAVWDEWRHISAHSAYNFEGMTYDRLREERGILWPCPTEDHPGTKRRYLPGEDPMSNGSGRHDFYGRPDGRAQIWLTDQQPPPEPTDAEYPLTLDTGRVLEHWHTMTITGPLPALAGVHPDFLEINPRDAYGYGIEDGDEVEVVSRRGSVSLRARVTDDIRQGVVFATFHSARHLVNMVTKDAFDRFSKEPDYKKCAVRVARREVAV